MLPVQRKSKMRKRTRRAHDFLRPMNLESCPQCGMLRRPHTACRNCGYVNNHTRVRVGDEAES